MIKFPYAISDFHVLRTQGYRYLDRTTAIPDLENAGKQLVFLRPRRLRSYPAHAAFVHIHHCF